MNQLIQTIKPLDEASMNIARERQLSLVKPPGSLGKLEDLSIQLAGISSRFPLSFPKKTLLVFAADNGVYEEGVSSAPQSVTLQQTINLTRKKTGASVLVDYFGYHIIVTDVGVNGDIHDDLVLNKKIAYGTKNILKEAAMTREQAEQAIDIGMGAVLSNDSDVFGIGEMGLGNTTTSSAILAVLLDIDVEEVTGRGAGLSDERFSRKKEIIRQAIAFHDPDKNDILDVLSKLGGFDIAAMAGAFLGAAIKRKPVVIDGLISAVSALVATRINPLVKGYLISSHASYEIGYRLAMQELGLDPMLLLDMRLGEGSGTPIAFQIIDASCAIYNNMATFEEASIGEEYLEEIKEGDAFSVESN